MTKIDSRRENLAGIYGKHIMTYNLYLFDLDGTLTDPKIGITKSYQYALAAFGIHEEPDNLTKFIGPPLREIFSFYGFSGSDTEKAVAKFREYYTDKGLFENVVYPGVPEILDKLKNNGLIMAVVTSKVTIYANRILEHFNLNEYFSLVLGDTMDGSLTKSGKSGLIITALETLKKPRMLPVMVGDRLHDILGARDAGIDSIGVTWGYGTPDELKRAGATWIVNKPSELCDRHLVWRENLTFSRQKHSSQV